MKLLTTLKATFFSHKQVETIVDKNIKCNKDKNITSGALDVSAYVRETLRILRVGGVFAVITTMPPSIFRTIVIDPLGDGNKNAPNVLTDWKICKKKKIRTNEGGYVYFYPIRKTSNIVCGQGNKMSERGESDRDEIERERERERERW